MKKTKLYFKALSALFAFVMCFSCFTGFSAAAGTPTLSVVGGEVDAEGEITVLINMSNNPGIAGMNAFISYDSDVLTPTAVAQGDALAGVMITSNIKSPDFKASDELLSINMFGPENSPGNGTFFKVTFKVNKGVSDVSSLISLNCTQATNQDLQEITVSSRGGSVKVLALDEKDDNKDDNGSDDTKQGNIKLRTKAR